MITDVRHNTEHKVSVRHGEDIQIVESTNIWNCLIVN